MTATTSIGAFELDKPIGHGGSAVVYRARHAGSQRSVALKLLRAKDDGLERLRQTFWEEAEAMAQLHHPGVAAVLDAGLTDRGLDLGDFGSLPVGSPWLAMEYIEGRDLSDVVGLLSWHELQGVLLQILDALAATHAAGVLHRDLKTANILVNQQRNGLKPTLVDFGIARGALHEGRDDAQRVIAGTPEFMAPEQIRGRTRDEGPWTDLYALGCVAWRLVAGKPPFVRSEVKDTLKAHLSEPPPDLDASSPISRHFYDWLLWLLEKSIFDRCQRAADAAKVLREMPSPDSASWGQLIEAPPAEEPSEPLLRPNAETHRIPESWRVDRQEAEPAQLKGGGLGLFGMRAIPLVDREEIRDHLWQQIRTVQEQQRPLATSIVGSFGSGKTKIAEWLARRTHAIGAVEFFHCTHSRRGGPTDGLGPMLNRYFRTVGMPRAEVRTRVRRHFERSEWTDDMASADCEALAEMIAPADTREGETPYVRFNSPEERYLTIYRLFERISEHRVILIWADDAHWANDATALGEFILDRGQDHPLPLFILGTLSLEMLDDRYDAYEALGRLQGHPDTTRFDLEPMTRGDIDTLVERVVGLERKFTEHIRAHADGNPLFALQILDHWVTNGLLEPGRNGFSLTTDEPTVPANLLDIWWDRLDSVFDKLDEADRTDSLSALELAAALGREFEDREWEKACAMCSYRQRDGVVREMAKQDLLRRTAEGWKFAHALLTDTLEASARDHERWRRHHSACADTIAELYDLSSHRVARRYATHLISAGRLEEALEPLERSALKFMTEGSPEESQALVRKFEEVVDTLDCPPDSRPRVQHARLEARLAKGRGDVDLARSIIEPAIETSRGKGWNRLLGICLTTYGSLLLDLTDPDRALEIMYEAVDRLEREDNPRDLARAYLSLAHAQRFKSQMKAAARTCGRAAEAYLEAGQPEAAAAVRLNEATFDPNISADEVDSRLREAERLASEAGDRRVMAFVALARGEFLLRSEQYEEARESYKRSAHYWASCGLKDRYVAELGQAMAALGEGISPPPIPTLRRLRHDAENAGLHFLRGELTIASALAHLRLGEVQSARNQVEQAADYWSQSPLASREFAWLADMVAEEAFVAAETGLACAAADLAAKCWRELGEAKRAEISEARVQ